MGLYQSTMKRLGKTRGFAAVMKHVLPPVDRAITKVTGGKANFANTVVPTFMLEHTGAKSGRTYRTPLAYIHVGDGFGLAATNWGQGHHPAWSTNLMANPEAVVELHGEKIPVRARLTDAAGKKELWSKFVEIWPAYDTYVERSGRDIRVFVLDRR